MKPISATVTSLIITILTLGIIGCSNFPFESDESGVATPCTHDSECAAYKCRDGKCVTKCQLQSDCNDGYTCNLQSGDCVPANENVNNDCPEEQNGTPMMLCLPGTGGEVYENDQFILNGSAVAYPPEAAITFLWTQISGADVEFVENSGDSGIWTFIAPEVSENSEVVFQLTASTDEHSCSTDTVKVNILDIPENNPPVFVSPDTSNFTITQGEMLTFTVEAEDPDGHEVTLTTNDLPDNAEFNGETGAFIWTPISGQQGNYVVTFIAADNGNPSQSAVLIVTIDIVTLNHPPVMASIGNKYVNEGEVISFIVNATDPDGDLLVLKAENLPENAIFKPEF